MRNLLEDDEAIQGMQYLNRATLLIHETKNPELILHFKLCQARILDASRKFLEAAVKYRIPPHHASILFPFSPFYLLLFKYLLRYLLPSSSTLLPLLTPQIPNPLTVDDVSFEPKVDESERLRCLSAAITCAVLAPAGPQRSRILATLYKDERASQSLPTDFAILEKMHFLRLLRPLEVSEFAKSLAPHQLAFLPGEGGNQVPYLSAWILSYVSSLSVCVGFLSI